MDTVAELRFSKVKGLRLCAWKISSFGSVFLW
jgi:hypothetical protein